MINNTIVSHHVTVTGRTTFVDNAVADSRQYQNEERTDEDEGELPVAQLTNTVLTSSDAGHANLSARRTNKNPSSGASVTWLTWVT